MDFTISFKVNCINTAVFFAFEIICLNKKYLSKFCGSFVKEEVREISRLIIPEKYTISAMKLSYSGYI